MLFFNSWFSFLFTSITFVLILDVNFLCICLLRFYDVFFITLFYESLKMYISFIFNNYIKPYLHFPTFRLGCLSHIYKRIRASKCESGLKIIFCVCVFLTLCYFLFYVRVRSNVRRNAFWSCLGNCFGNAWVPVSYTHLTLPTKA